MLRYLAKFSIAVALFLLLFIEATEAKEVTMRLNLTEDTTVHNSFPYTSYNGRHYLALGYESKHGYLKSRIYVKYDLSQIHDPQIKPEQIISANLRFMQNTAMGTAATHTVQLIEPQATWSGKNITWDNQPTYKVLKEITQPKSNGWKSYDISDLVRTQLVSQDWGKGLALRFKDEDLRGVHYWSNECILITDILTCALFETPHLEIVYDDFSLLPAVTLSPEQNISTNNPLVKFAWESSSTGDGILHRVQVSETAEFSNPIYQSEFNGQTEHDYLFENDGQLFWRIESKDSDGASVFSSISSFDLDRKAPDAPELSTLPNEISGDSVPLLLRGNQDGERYTLEYRIQYSTNLDFLTPLEKSTLANEYTWNQLPVGDAFFRVRTLDRAGNTSNWSNIVTTKFVESDIEKIHFTIDTNYISPTSSPGVKDKAEITVVNQSDKPDSNSKVLRIYDFKLKEPKSVKFSAEKIVIPSNGIILADGQYLISIEEEENPKSKSNLEYLVVDNQSPKPPIISRESEKSLINGRELLLNITSESDTSTQILLNEIIINEDSKNENSININLTTEGENVVRVIVTDKAGNSASTSIKVTTDWTPPPPPIIKLKPDTTSKALKLEVISEENSEIEVYNPAGLHKREKSSETDITLIEPWTQNITYSFFAHSIDEAGNRSGASREVTYKTPAESVLGVATERSPGEGETATIAPSVCEFTYNKSFKLITKSDCNLSRPKIDQLNHIRPQSDLYWINVFGEHNRAVKLIIRFVRCRDFEITKPKTWTGCDEVDEKRVEKEVQSYGEIITQVNKRKLPEYQNRWNANNRYQLLTATGENLTSREIKNQAEIYFSYKIDKDVWIDYKAVSHLSNPLTLPKPEIVNKDGTGSKYFSFPFNKIIGVTQWHGKTVFSDHTGIDFGAVREPINAMADGYIQKAEWDNYNGTCLSGGYYLQVAHDNGMHSVYLHLSEFTKDDGSTIKIGERVKKGQRIGVSGNSGAYDCKPLGYHLHLEVRKDQHQRNNVDPVKWIDVDWDKVITLDAARYPGRLSGNNPHPSY